MKKEDFCDTTWHQPLVDQIKPILADHQPSIQSTVIAELLATWLVQARPDLREGLFQKHIEFVRTLIPVIEQEVYGARGPPGRKMITGH